MTAYETGLGSRTSKSVVDTQRVNPSSTTHQDSGEDRNVTELETGQCPSLVNPVVELIT